MNDDDGLRGWGEDRMFHALSAAAAQSVLERSADYDVVVVVTGTSLFSRVAGMLHRLGPEVAERLLIVHTFGMAVNGSGGLPSGAEIDSDGDLAFWVKQSQRVCLAPISDYTARLYREQWAIPDASLLLNRSGIPLTDPRFRPLDTDECITVARSMGVPDGPLAVMWGRAEFPGLDKGYRLLLQAAAQLGTVTPIIATREPSRELAHLAAPLGPAVLLHEQPFHTISALLQHPMTVASLFLGAAEPGAVSPLEAMWTSRERGAPVVVANVGNLPELADGGRAAIVTERTTDSVAAALQRALAMTSGERASMRSAAAAMVRTDGDVRLNIRRFIDECLQRAIE
ncbi:glycosyltransferase family 4 protein [Rhodococcus sp. 06-235-1A]|uniref:glycosyltransferase family 4 protein n=1 Tax=Rhodococcus sp. 06-235-1A TaxID=2022508 RepID=UPI00117A6935|nr:glycosyltransferase family 4 protein [Rhodococcus sp. 06-235-1A]